MVSFPHYSHTTPLRIPKDMGVVWEAYHKGVPLWGVPENTIEVICLAKLEASIKLIIFKSYNGWFDISDAF